MAELKIRLNDIVSPKEVKEKKRGPIYCISNSLKRNAIAGSKKHTLPYEAKLPALHYSRKEIAHMLKYLLSKQSMNAPDRNLIRRFLVGVFDQELIHAGSKDFIAHLDIKEGREDTIERPQPKTFYMVLKGEVIVRSQGIEYEREEGQTFGQLQIMAKVDIEAVYYTKNTLMLTMQENHFQQFFLPTFRNLYSDRQAQLLCITTILNSVPVFCKYLFLSKYETRTYQMGDKIIEEGEEVDYLYIVSDKLKEERLKYLQKGCIGLNQIQKGKNQYFQTVYCPQNDMKLPFFKKKHFKQYIIDVISQHPSFENNSSLLHKSLVNTCNSIEDPELKAVKFLKTKRVKLVPSKRSKTESAFPIQNQFKFLKHHDQMFIKTFKRLDTQQTPQGRKKKFSISMKRSLKVTLT